MKTIRQHAEDCEALINEQDQEIIQDNFDGLKTRAEVIEKTITAAIGERCVPQNQAMVKNFENSYGGKLKFAWVKIPSFKFEGIITLHEKSIGWYGGDRMSPIPEDMVILQYLTGKGITFDIEACKIVNALSQLFGAAVMSEIDAADFKDKASELFELMLQSREAVSNL